VANVGAMSSFLWPAGFSSFLSRLKYPKILQEVEKINQDYAVGISKVGIHEAASGNLTEDSDAITLPRIIVIGDESSGKSSTLERIAMADVLPRNTGICTRQPIALKLRHDPEVDYKAPRVTLLIPGERGFQEEGLSCKAACEKITLHMQQVAEKEGVITDKEIVVELHSNGVPTLDLVDLPGLVAVREQDETLSRLTRECTQQYLAREDTGAVVCVLDATIPNLRTSHAVRLLQDAPKAAKEFAIGVFARCDKAADCDWEDEGYLSEHWKLQQRLLGTSEEYKAPQGTPESDATAPCLLGMTQGFIAVKNRNTKSKKHGNLSLEDHNKEELQWFAHNVLSESCGLARADQDAIKGCVGLDALVQRIDSVICHHLDERWVPVKIQELQARRALVAKEIETLGKPGLLLSELRQPLKTKFETYFSPAAIEALCKRALGELPTSEPAPLGDRYARVKKTQSYEEEVSAFVRGAVENEPESLSLFARVRQEVTARVAQCFDEDAVGDIQLCRFFSTRDFFVRSTGKCLFLRETKFLSVALQHMRLFFRQCCMHGNETLFSNVDALRHLLSDVIVRSLIPVVQGLFELSALASEQHTPQDGQNPKRKELESKLEANNKMEQKLQGGFKR